MEEDVESNAMMKPTDFDMADGDGADEMLQNSGAAPLAQRLSTLSRADKTRMKCTAFREENIGIDVVFVVGADQHRIGAHRLILASSSKVFSAMFYGTLKADERRASDILEVSVPDVTAEAFTALTHFLYTDLHPGNVELNDDIVMHTLYAAKKYDVHPLVFACVRYLLRSLNPGNSVWLLAQARFFDEPQLIERCLKVIDAETDIALSAHGAQEIDRQTLCAILERSTLDPTSELVVFKTAEAWSEAECVRQRIDVTSANKRSVLGPALSLIRFPLMSVTEFGEAASSGILTCEEIAQVFLHLTVEPRPPVPYPVGLRCSSRSRHVVSRFPSLSGKRCNRRENKICFSVDRDILVTAFGIYGIVPVSKPHMQFYEEKAVNEWQSQVEIQLAPAPDARELMGSCALIAETAMVRGRVGDAKPLRVAFSKPLAVPANVNYIASIRFMNENGVLTFAGKDGLEAVTVKLPFGESATFRFQSVKNAYGNDDGSRLEGQIPDIHFFVQWDDK